MIAGLHPAIVPYAAEIAFGIVIVFTTLLSLILGELIPKRIALAAPEPMAAAMAPLMALIERGASPVVWLLRTATEGVLRLLGLNRTRQEDVTEEELQSLIVEGEKAGVIEEEEREMIQGVMRLGDRSVKTIMTPRTEMVWLDPETTARGHAQGDRATAAIRAFPSPMATPTRSSAIVQTKELFAHLARTGNDRPQGRDASADLRARDHARAEPAGSRCAAIRCAW